jgi:hypothetical protein
MSLEEHQTETLLRTLETPPLTLNISLQPKIYQFVGDVQSWVSVMVERGRRRVEKVVSIRTTLLSTSKAYSRMYKDIYELKRFENGKRTIENTSWKSCGNVLRWLEVDNRIVAW